MNIYEGLFIFGESVQEERVKEMTAHATAEIEKLGGKITGTRDMGRRPFARTMQKKETGFYVAVTFQMSGEKLAALNARYRLNDDIFRVQIVKLDEEMAKKTPPVSSPTAPNRYERGDRYEGGSRGGDRYEGGSRDRGDRYERSDRFPAGHSAS
ncbi:MAG: 30S ribosomal protein S6 [bacterium]